MSSAVMRLNPGLCSAQSGPVEKESTLHYEIMDFCRSVGWQFLHGSMAERTHRTEGEPDFIILASGGLVALVECKSRVGKLSAVQAAFRHQAERNGHQVHVVRCMKEFLAIFSQRELGRE